MGAIRDWWRGYSDADIASLRAKLHESLWPGKVIPLSNREMKAMVELPREDPIEYLYLMNRLPK